MSCFVPNCITRSSYGNKQSKVSRFLPPKDITLFKKWSDAIQREDFPLTRQSKVCALHFCVDDIITTYDTIINGEVISIARDKPLLKKGAVPYIFPAPPSHLSQKRKKRKISPKLSSTGKSASQPNLVHCEEIDAVTSDSSSLEVATNNAPTADDLFSPEVIISERAASPQETSVKEEMQLVVDMDMSQTCLSLDVLKVKLPPQWVYCPCSEYEWLFAKLSKNEQHSHVFVAKNARLNVKECRMYFYVNANAAKIDNLTSVEVNTKEQVTDLIARFDDMVLCPGIPASKYPGIDVAATGEIKDGAWISHRCHLVAFATSSTVKACAACCKLNQSLQVRWSMRRFWSTREREVRFQQMNQKELQEKIIKLKRENKNLRSQVLRMAKRIQSMKSE